MISSRRFMRLVANKGFGVMAALRTYPDRYNNTQATYPTDE